MYTIIVLSCNASVESLISSGASVESCMCPEVSSYLQVIPLLSYSLLKEHHPQVYYASLVSINNNGSANFCPSFAMTTFLNLLIVIKDLCHVQQT